MTSVCEQLQWVSILHCCWVFRWRVFTFMGQPRAGLQQLWVFQGRGILVPRWLLASQATRLAASVPTGGWLCLRPRPCWLAATLLAMARGRAGQGLWWALDPRLDLGINILSCWRLCLLGPGLTGW